MDIFKFLCKKSYLQLVISKACTNLQHTRKIFVICSSQVYETQYICNIFHLSTVRARQFDDVEIFVFHLHKTAHHSERNTKICTDE